MIAHTLPMQDKTDAKMKIVKPFVTDRYIKTVVIMNKNIDVSFILIIFKYLIEAMFLVDNCKGGNKN